jgi:hypothetical protein
MGVPNLGLLQLWGPRTFFVDLRLIWGLKKNCSPCWKLSNGMWHATCTQGNLVDSQLLAVVSQIANVTPNLSFDHNLCFICPNGSCKPISDIYVPRAFQWHRNASIQWVLTPAIALWRFESPPGFQLPKWEFPWECEGWFPHILLHSREHEMWLPSFLLGPHSYKPFALVASPRLGLQH